MYTLGHSSQVAWLAEEAARVVGLGERETVDLRRAALSRRTAEHHVQHVHAKIGHSTRAAATLFAMEHDLLRE